MINISWVKYNYSVSVKTFAIVTRLTNWNHRTHGQRAVSLVTADSLLILVQVVCADWPPNSLTLALVLWSKLLTVVFFKNIAPVKLWVCVVSWHLVSENTFSVMHNHTLFLCLQISTAGTRPQVIWAIKPVIADWAIKPSDCRWSLQSSSGVCAGMYWLTYSLHHPRGI